MSEKQLELMELFRRDMTGIEPTSAHHDEDPYPAFKVRPLVFKYEHHSFLFKVWKAGHNTAHLEVPGFYQLVEDSDLKEIEAFLGNGDLPTQSFFMRPDASRLANIAMHLVREVQALRLAAKSQEEAK